MAKGKSVDVSVLSQMPYLANKKRAPFNHDEVPEKSLKRFYHGLSFRIGLSTVFFNLLALIFTGGIFHILWFTLVRPFLNWEQRTVTHKNWLMRFESYRTAKEAAILAKELLDDKNSDTTEISSESAENTESTTSEFISDSNASENDPQVYNERYADPILSQEKTRRLLFKVMDTQALIDSFIKPVFHEARRDALLELCINRRTEKSLIFKKQFLRYHLIHDTYKYQPLTADDLKAMLAANPTKQISCYIQTWLTKLGHESRSSTIPFLQAFGPYTHAANFCLLALKDKITTQDMIEYDLTIDHSKTNQRFDLILFCKKGLKNINPTIKQKLFVDYFFQRVEWQHVKFNHWSEEDQNRFLDILLIAYDPFCEHKKNQKKDAKILFKNLDFSSFNKNPIRTFFDKILSNVTILSSRSVKTNIRFLCTRLLNTLTDEDLLNEFIEKLFLEYENLKDYYDKIEILTILIHIDFKQVPDGSQKHYLELLLKQVNISLKTPKSIDFQLLEETEGDSLIEALTQKCFMQQYSIEFIRRSITALSHLNIHSMYPNQIAIITRCFLDLLEAESHVATVIKTIYKLGISNFPIEHQILFANIANNFINNLALQEIADNPPTKKDRHIVYMSVQLMKRLNFSEINVERANTYKQTLTHCVFVGESWLHIPLQCPQIIELDRSSQQKILDDVARRLTEALTLKNLLISLYQLQYCAINRMESEVKEVIFIIITDCLMNQELNHSNPFKACCLALQILSKYHFSDLEENQQMTYLDCLVRHFTIKQPGIPNDKHQKRLQSECFELANHMLSRLRIDKLSPQQQLYLAKSLINIIYSHFDLSIRFIELFKRFDEKIQTKVITALLQKTKPLKRKNGVNEEDADKEPTIQNYYYKNLRLLALLHESLNEEQAQTLMTLYRNIDMVSKIKLLNYFWPLMDEADKCEVLPNIKETSNSESDDLADDEKQYIGEAFHISL